MKKAIIVSMALVLTAFAYAQTPGTKAAAKSGAKSSGYQWAVSSGGSWKWVNAPLSAEEQASLDQALQQAGGAGPDNYVLMIANGEKLSFQTDTEKKESVDRVAKQALFKTGDQRFRVVPKGNSYMILKARLEKTAA
jgi:hypothetical protein